MPKHWIGKTGCWSGMTAAEARNAGISVKDDIPGHAVLTPMFDRATEEPVNDEGKILVKVPFAWMHTDYSSIESTEKDA